MPEATKALGRVEVKDADQGLVRAVFSTFGAIDSDGDVTEPGAFRDGQAVRISAYGHASWGGALPVGKGTIHADETEAWLDGELFLQTAAGRETFETLKAMGDLQEWSYGYDVKEMSFGEHEGQRVRFLKELHVHEVSPVLVGAGVDTRTLDLKAQGLTFTDHLAQVHAAVREAVERSKALAALRAKEGRVLSAANRERLGELLEAMRMHASDLEQLLADTDPDPKAQARAVWLQALRAGNL